VARQIEIHLPKRDVTCVAELLDDVAPRTCAAVWQSLPVGGPIYHAKYARNELYTFVPAPELALGLENPTVTPIPGDLVYFEFTSGMLPALTYGYTAQEGAGDREAVVDLAVFYGRNNLLLNADVGFVPGNVFATIVEGLDELAAAGNDVWRAGAVGEELRFRHHDSGSGR